VAQLPFKALQSWASIKRRSVSQSSSGVAR